MKKDIKKYKKHFCVCDGGANILDLMMEWVPFKLYPLGQVLYVYILFYLKVIYEKLRKLQ